MMLMYGLEGGEQRVVMEALKDTEGLPENIETLSADIQKNATVLKNLMKNVTKHRGLLHGFTESISVILVSEIGDKTFFIAAILAMRNSKVTVLGSALSALYLMTILSALLGWVVTTFIPREITYYTCTAIMFAFALKMFWEAWHMGEDEMQETQKEVEHELADLEGGQRDPQDMSGDMPGGLGADMSTQGHGQDRARGANQGQDNQGYQGNEARVIPAETQDQGAMRRAGKSSGSVQGQQQGQEQEGTRARAKEGWVNRKIDQGCKENPWFGYKCLQVLKLVVNTFTLTFIAEWGDRSQLATIVLAGINDVVGVILGGCLGHTICTVGAVLAGALIARFVSIRKITFLGALVFLGFAIASIFIDPNEDGVDGIPEIEGYDNATRLINHNITLTIELEKEKAERAF